MPDIFELVDAKAIGEYVSTIAAADEPLLGATLFPSKKVMGLDLKWVKGYKRNAVALRPSALGARAFVRDRIGASIIQHEIPFFREKMVISERLRQELARAKMDATDPYTSNIIEQIFDDAKSLTDGANVQAERLRMQLLFGGQISIKAPAEDGGQPYFDYNYDVNGDWNTNNVTTLTLTDVWSDYDDSNPINDILDVVDDASGKGVTLTRAIVSPKTFRDIMANANVKNMFRNADGTPRVFTRGQLIAEIATLTGVTIAVYNKAFVDEAGNNVFYAPDDKMVLFPDGALGATVYGTTPEEIDLMSGYGNAVTSIVNTGVAVTTSKQYGPPVTVETVVSELVIPSFERMEEVFLITY